MNSKKNILGLDLGTNSIGWALISRDDEKKHGKIDALGSRIIPMTQEVLGKFGDGSSVSQTAERTRLRMVRRLHERYLLRRQRLHRVLNVLGFLPDHFSAEIDFEKRLGQFIDEREPKLAYSNGVFLFRESFEEMLEDFRLNQPDLLERKNRNGEDAKIPYDWTLYYLRKKALTSRISKEELAWVILNFNQKRGYHQLRGEEEETTDKREYVELLRVVGIEKGEPDKKNNRRTWYTISLSNGWSYSATFTSEPNWLNMEKEFLVTEELDENGEVRIVKDKKSDTSGKAKRRITPLPSYDEIDAMSKAEQDKIYGKIKAKTELTISNSDKTVGAYIYDALLRNPQQKINGKLVRTIDRKFYKDELKRILLKQQDYHPELRDATLLADAVRDLYRKNEGHQAFLESKDIVHLILDDILFYQRPLRSKKSAISNCAFECRKFKGQDGIWNTEYLKVAPRSNPYFQEFRVWQWIQNLKIYRKEDDLDVTSDFLKNQLDLDRLFDFLMLQKEIDMKSLLKYLLSARNQKSAEIKTEITKYRWNYVYDPVKDESKKYPCNETGYEFRRRLEKVQGAEPDFLNTEREYHLWHLIYSVTDKEEFEKALRSFAERHQLDVASFEEAFRKFPPFKSEYASFSEKAIKKLLPLMRSGVHWNWENIHPATKERIDKILSGEFDESIRTRVREKSLHLQHPSDFQGLPLWLASYIVYDRHSEAENAGRWRTLGDLEDYLQNFKQHSLRNPIVEQVVTETLRVVRDIWNKYGQGKEGFFDEIHIELGREMKNTADERKRLTANINENEQTNQRIRLLLAEFASHADIDNVRPHSPYQQDLLRIYEEAALNSSVELPDFVADTLKKFREIDQRKQPSKAEVTRYKLWLDQQYRSPYTGEMIPLSKLFTSAYEIEHVIPQSRYFDDSMSNKVICESAVNKLKDNMLGFEFIKKHHGEIVDTGYGRKVQILTEEAYQEFVKKQYANNRSKRTKLLLEEIPEGMIERQLNDTRYISKFISSLLSNLVRSEKNDDGVNSKNLLAGNGKITSELRHDWGLSDVWNGLILPRFERMNQLTNSSAFTSVNSEGHVIPSVPMELSKGFQKKRIDHRHHALDALVIACATRDHVNLLNNQAAKSETTRYDLQHKLRYREKWTDKDGRERSKFTSFMEPWSGFQSDAREALERVVVSFKQNLRVINKATNKYEKWGLKDGRKVKISVEQEGVNWAIRKPMHKDTVSGQVNLPRIKVAKGKILTATRKSLNTSFDLKAIESITDTGIQKILTNYLKQEQFKEVNAKGEVRYNPELAFTPEGIEYMNRHIRKFNDGKDHQPIYKVRVFEMGSKFPLGQKGNKGKKFVEAAKGTNLFFAVYVDETGKRSFETVALNEVIERQKQGLTSVPEINEKGHRLLFHLSPNDLVYVPENPDTDLTKTNFQLMSKEVANRVYKMVSSTGSECHFILANIASLVKGYDAQSKVGELGSLNKLETTVFGSALRIKEVCVKLHVDRLGNVSVNA